MRSRFLGVTAARFLCDFEERLDAAARARREAVRVGGVAMERRARRVVRMLRSVAVRRLRMVRLVTMCVLPVKVVVVCVHRHRSVPASGRAGERLLGRWPTQAACPIFASLEQRGDAIT